jgi:hypothetical protein
MRQLFKLVRAGDYSYSKVTPSCGEALGDMLAKAASLREGDYRCAQTSVEHWGNTVAQVYYLAAEAYEQGASASIGHNRSDRYLERAKELRGKAEALLDEAKTARDAIECKRMKAAFVAGYEGQDGSRYVFDAREAFLVGKHYAAQGMPIPATVRVVREERGKHFIEAGDCRYSVEYPGGKISAAIVALAE